MRRWNPQQPLFYPMDKILKIGHRGAPSLAPENTIPSFKKAIEAGIQGIELDLQFSADRQLVVFHDWDLINLTGSKSKIEDIQYSDIKNISRNQEGEDVYIPLFQEVLEIIPRDCIINVEIKSAYIRNTGIEKSVLELLGYYNLEGNCIISSFNPIILRRVRKLDSKIPTAFLWSNDNPLFIINSPLWVWYCQPDGFHPDINDLNEQLMNWARKKHMKIITFIINNQSNLNKALKLGVDGIFTDFPHIID